MNHWLTALDREVVAQRACVLVNVVEAAGSTPREVGAKMIVTETGFCGSIGGGALEHESIELARRMLGESSPPRLERYLLGADMGQCCGGAVTVAFERIDGAARWLSTAAALHAQRKPLVVATVVASKDGARSAGGKLIVTESIADGDIEDRGLEDAVVRAGRRLLRGGPAVELGECADAAGKAFTVVLDAMRPDDFFVMVFGAGHVGRALVPMLTGVPCTLEWIDPRPDVFPDDVTPNLTCINVRQPELEVDRAPPGAYFVVMTHSHPLDQAICERILERNDFRYCGLIGSGSKRARFEKRFVQHGIPKERLSRLTCPIGLTGIGGKRPAEIAVAVAAELLRLRSLERAAAVPEAAAG